MLYEAGPVHIELGALGRSRPVLAIATPADDVAYGVARQAGYPRDFADAFALSE
jgi:hypothetical protein